MADELWEGIEPSTGLKALYVLPSLDENDPELEYKAASRRMTLGDPCPYCDSVRPALNRKQRRSIKNGGAVVRMQLRHDDDCEWFVWFQSR